MHSRQSYTEPPQATKALQQRLTRCIGPSMRLPKESGSQPLKPHLSGAHELQANIAQLLLQSKHCIAGALHLVDGIESCLEIIVVDVSLHKIVGHQWHVLRLRETLQELLKHCGRRAERSLAALHTGYGQIVECSLHHSLRRRPAERLFQGQELRHYNYQAAYTTHR